MTEAPLRVVVVGGFSSGKSALINALLRERIAPMGVLPVTAVSHRFVWGDTRVATVVDQAGGRVARPLAELAALIGNAAEAQRVSEVVVSLPYAALKGIELWDTPGFGSGMLAHELAARRALSEADVVLWVTPIDQALSKGEVEKLQRLVVGRAPVLLAVNKADKADDEVERDSTVAKISAEAAGLVVDTVWVSAREALAEGEAARQRGNLPRLETRLAELLAGERSRRLAHAKEARSAASANDVVCPDCKEIGRHDDRYCVCGRELADQHRGCPRCAADNVVRRPRCRSCNLAFNDWERAEAYRARAEEEVALGLLLDAEATLAAALSIVPDHPQLVERHAAVTASRAHAQEWAKAAKRVRDAAQAQGEWQRAWSELRRIGVPEAVAWRCVGRSGVTWAATTDPLEGEAALTWWAERGVRDAELWGKVHTAADTVRAENAARAVREEEARVELARKTAAAQAGRAARRAAAEEADRKRQEDERRHREEERQRQSAAVIVTAENLESTIGANGIVILDFWASWCDPCARFAPTFEAAAQKHTDIVFGKIDTEAEQSLAAQLQIQSIPTLMVFVDQILLYREAGALPPAAFEDLIAQVKTIDMEQVRREIATRESAPPLATEPALNQPKAPAAPSAPPLLPSVPVPPYNESAQDLARRLVQEAKQRSRLTAKRPTSSSVASPGATPAPGPPPGHAAVAARASTVREFGAEASGTTQGGDGGGPGDQYGLGPDIRVTDALVVVGTRISVDVVSLAGVFVMTRSSGMAPIGYLSLSLLGGVVAIGSAVALTSAATTSVSSGSDLVTTFGLEVFGSLGIPFGLVVSVTSLFLAIFGGHTTRHDVVVRDKLGKATRILATRHKSEAQRLEGAIVMAIRRSSPPTSPPSPPPVVMVAETRREPGAKGERVVAGSGQDWLSPTLGVMKRIPAGRFTMGSPTSESGHQDDEAQALVTLTHAFWMMEHEVTQAEWRAVMGTSPSKFAGCDACPVEQVSWDDAVSFAKKASARDGVAYRLPTEAEWERAARGGQEHVFAGSQRVDDVGWTSGNSGSKTHPVCGLARNGFGLCDMSGNVWEWTADWYTARLAGGSDPAGPSSGSYRVIRGGCWLNDPVLSRVAARNGVAPSIRRIDLGFRLVRPAP